MENSQRDGNYIMPESKTYSKHSDTTIHTIISINDLMNNFQSIYNLEGDQIKLLIFSSQKKCLMCTKPKSNIFQ